jgi:anti-anti-sigma regulatory factor
MKFKIDTKEKFTIITPFYENSSDKLTAEINELLLSYLQKAVKNIVLNLKNVDDISEQIAAQLAETQQAFYDNNASLVMCELQPEIEKKLETLDVIDLMNITPTESEAYDILQMEEIERELMDDDNPLFNDHHDNKS